MARTRSTLPLTPTEASDRLNRPIPTKLLFIAAILLGVGKGLGGEAELRLRYAFEGDFSDSGPSNNAGVASGAAALTASPALVLTGAGSLLLDGGDASYVALSRALSFSASNAWTAAFWARRGETGGSKGMALGTRNTASDFVWLNDSFTGLRFRSSTGATLDFTTPKDTAAHHYVLVAAGDGKLSLFVDGAWSADKSTNTSFAIDSVGQAYTTNSLHYAFKGALDDVRVYAGALDDAGVRALFQLDAPATSLYAFEGDAGDSGSRANPGTLSGEASLAAGASQAAVGSGALAIDGAGSYVALSNSLYFATNSPWSVAFWAKRGELGANKGMVLGCRTNTTDFVWLNDSYQGLRFRSANNKTLDLVAPKDLAYHHYALATAGDGRMSLFVDGVCTTNAATAGTSLWIDSIGKAYTGTTYDFKGLLDDVRIYAYAVSSNEVAALAAMKNADPPLATSTVTRVRVYLQGGQSNADGRADPAQLPTTPVNLQAPQADVDFFYTNRLTTLRPSTWFSSALRFGPEITCGRRLADLLALDASNRIAVIKYAVGGTSLYSDWKAGGGPTTAGDGPRYVSFQQAVTNGLLALAAAYPGATLSLEGMTGMQGESDVPTASASYFANLTNFIADVRATYACPRLPFVIGRLSSAQTGISGGTPASLGAVRQAQSAAAAADPWCGGVDTDGFALNADNLHFSASGQQALGRAFAEQLLYLKGLEGRFTPQQLAAGAAEPGADPDGDGADNWSEYLAGTDPSDRQSTFAATESGAGGGAFVVRWRSAAGRVYAVERCTNWAARAFTAVATNLPARPPVNVYTDAAPSGASGFYRIRAERP